MYLATETAPRLVVVLVLVQYHQHHHNKIVFRTKSLKSVIFRTSPKIQDFLGGISILVRIIVTYTSFNLFAFSLSSAFP